MIPQTSLKNVDIVRRGVGRPLALAHGASANVGFNFGVMLDEFATERAMVGINYPGSGATPLTHSALSLDLLADQLVAAAVADGHERFPIVGISLGSAVAVTAAARHPDRVTGLVLTVGFATADVSLVQLGLVREALLQAGDATAHARLLLLVCNSPNTLAELSASDVETIVPQFVAGLPEGAMAQTRLASTVDIREQAAGLQLPVQVFVSGSDRIVLPSSTRALADLIRGAEVVEYPDAAHVHTPTEGRRWSQDVREFLNRHEL